MSKLKEQLEVSGCRIIEENENKLVVACPVKILEAGLKLEGEKSVQTKREGNEITLTIKKEGEE